MTISSNERAPANTIIRLAVIADPSISTKAVRAHLISEGYDVAPRVIYATVFSTRETLRLQAMFAEAQKGQGKAKGRKAA